MYIERACKKILIGGPNGGGGGGGGGRGGALDMYILRNVHPAK